MLFHSIDLDYYFSTELQLIVRTLTKYIRLHVSLWKYPDYAIDKSEVNGAISSVLTTPDEIRVALHILKHQPNKNIVISHLEVCMYVDTMISYACGDFLHL